jgi:hypothetical protein
MTAQEFEKKYEQYLEENYIGLEINDENVINFLDNVFTDLIKIPGFKYHQIKLKFGMPRFYTNLDEVFPKFSIMMESEIEKQIEKLLKK